METKQVIVMRTDLNMRKGKMVAQGSHASIAFLVEVLKTGRSLTDTETQWLTKKFTKICVGVDSEEALREIERRAKDAGVLVHLIVDSGLTEFNGVATPTCLAVGPDEVSRVDLITGNLRLL